MVEIVAFIIRVMERYKREEEFEVELTCGLGES